MEAMTRTIAAAASLLLISACASSWRTAGPVTGIATQSSSDVVLRREGRLRRLVLLPPVFETVPERCAERLMLPVGSYAQVIGHEAKKFLVNWKDYEVIEPGKPLAEADARAIAHKFGLWQEKAPEERMPPEPLRAGLQAIVRNLEADGAIVFRAAPECIDWIDVTFAIYTFGIPNLYRKMAGPNFSVGIYEGAGGSLVWQRYDSLDFMCWDNSGCVADKTRFLLRTLENAVPAALVDPVTSFSK